MSTLPRLIVQHTPKCAGSSLRRALARAYTAKELYSDTLDEILSAKSLFRLDRERYFTEARAIRPTEALVIGHFPIAKYAHLEGLRVATLRHPIRRTISHYFWLQAQAKEGPLLERIREGKLSLFEFAALPHIAGFYGDFFFTGVTPDDFDLLVFAERFPRGLRRLSELIGAPLKVQRVNTTEGSDPAVATEMRKAGDDPKIKAELGRMLADEIEWFQAATRSHAAAWS